jgi:glutamine synthetase
LPELRSKQNVELFERHGIFTSEEVDSRCEIMLENLAKTIHIEALTLVDMVNKEILPSVLSYIGELAKVSLKKSELGISAGFERDLARKLSALCDKTANGIAKLERSVTYAEKKQNVLEKASAYDKDIRKQMEELRENIDEMERKTAKKYWSYPTYADMLFYN